jgi:D-glycero-alpha-D-manno-heptose-7-phosphate kinase
LIITRTPYRLSFFGGGSDYPAYFEKHGGAVISTTIDKYVYISLRKLPPFFEHKHRIVWSQIENINKLDEIHHPAVRECLKFMDIQDGIAINHDGDLPARSGMGSSSAFTVGLLKALYTLRDEDIIKYRLAREAIYVEQQLIKENVGNQDQVAVACGGLNRIDFSWSDKELPIVKDCGVGFSVRKLDITTDRLRELESHLMLVFTGFPRTASEIVGTYNFHPALISTLKEHVAEAEHILVDGCDIKCFGSLMNTAWEMKKLLSNAVSTPYIDFLYDKALKAGAMGGKLVGAGGGGFMLLFCEPAKQEEVKKALKGLLFVPFKFENKGTQVILNNGHEDR